MKQKSLSKFLVAMLTLSMVSACSPKTNTDMAKDTIHITLSDEEILVNGEKISTDSNEAVYVGEPIIYYEEGKDASYGEGEAQDAHSQEEADLHTVVTITKSGEYTVSGSLSHGQIHVDLGEDAKKDPEAVVTLTLDSVDITNTVAPAILVMNVYECGDDEDPTMEVDTSKAGFHLVLADEKVNTLNGAYVAKIYKEGTTSKLHKYDGAISSKRSMTISGNGKLEVNAENEGISSNMHLSVNGGYIEINSHDDAVNTSEDNVSVFEMNAGTLICNSGLGSEGDGIDSNGWIVINGGNLVASANGMSMDSGLDADLGIYTNGGTVVSTGHMYDAIEADSKQMFGVFNFSGTRDGQELLTLIDSKNETVASFASINDYSILVFSSDVLEEGDHTLYGMTQLGHISGMHGNMGMRPNGNMQFDPNQMPQDFQPGTMPEGFDPQQGRPNMGNFDPNQLPEGFNGEINGFDLNNMPGFDPNMIPQGGMPGSMPNMNAGELSTVFTFSGIMNTFFGITEVSE